METLFENFICREAHGEYLPYILLCKNPSKVTSAIFFAADVTMLDCIKIAPRQFTPQGLEKKNDLGSSPKLTTNNIESAPQPPKHKKTNM